MQLKNIREEELKNKIAQEYFWQYDCTKIIGNVDFCVAMFQNKNDSEYESFLWAEAKKGSADILTSLVQLILTIGKARTFDKYLPPAMLGAFDSEKIAFIPYSDIHDIFYINDFNWNVAPSNYETKEFRILYDKVKNIINKETLLFYYQNDDYELRKFIKDNFIIGKFGLTKIKIDKNNFMVIYNKWLQEVKPTISVNWDVATKNGIIDGDFYLADLISYENTSLKENLFVVLKATKYEFNRFKDQYGAFTSSTVEFNDKQLAHTQFWNKYERPPKEEYWDYIIERRDLLVPQDIRERKGSFFTPQIWVELSQKYLTDVLGDNWQDEYYIWDCAAGTGNLLFGLTNKYNIWASTLDKQDVDVMKDRIRNGANLLEDHVFQFDFLNDDFSKLPKPLLEIINNPAKRKKLVIYINPPYAETNAKKGTSSGKLIGKSGVNLTKQHSKYNTILGRGRRELFAQFLVRIYFEINSCHIAIFSKIKIINAPFFSNFRMNFRAKLKKIFIVEADSFDNVEGKFPIGFQIWDTTQNGTFQKIQADVFDKKGNFISTKGLYSYDNTKYINDWIIERRIKTIKNNLGRIFCVGSDFQHQSYCRINSQNIPNQSGFTIIDINRFNLIECCVFFAVRHCIQATWLNDRDQFLYPNDGWKEDIEFQNDCLAFTIFHSQNRITSKESTNHWIPFTEYEVNSREKFDSNFMANFINGKKIDLKFDNNSNLNNTEIDELFGKIGNKITKLEFSSTAKKVFESGKELWKYYHSQENCNVNASLYDIREYFQGRNKIGKMNNKSDDEKYTELIEFLRDNLKILANKIEPKIYKYGFLKI